MGKLDKLLDAEFWKGRRVLVTGIDGFLGTALAKRLDGICPVFGLIKDYDLGGPFAYEREMGKLRSIKTYTGDIRNYDDFVKMFVEARPNVIFHLAAVTQVVDSTAMPRINHEINVMGTVNVFEALKDYSRGDEVIVTASSDKAYGHLSDEEWPANEDSRMNPIHPYDASKACADIIARSYSEYYGLKGSVTRCGNIYGPSDTNWQRLIPGVIRWLYKGEKIVLRSNGYQVREYNYIDDILNAYMLIAESLDPYRGADEVRTRSGESYVISDSDGGFGARDILGHILTTEAVANWPLESGVEFKNKAKEETPLISLDSTKIRKKLGWKPKTKLPNGLNKTARWLERYLTWSKR